MALTWNDLFSCGTLIDTDISQHRFQVKILPEDVGMTDVDGSLKKAVDMGHKKLISNEKLQPISSIIYHAKREVDSNSIDFPLVRGAKFIPMGLRDSLIEKLRGYKVAFESAVEVLISDYEANKAEQLPIIRAALEKYTESKPNQAEIVEQALQRINNRYPTAAEIRSKFGFVWKAFSISAPINQETAEALAEESNSVKEVVNNMVSRLRKELMEKIQQVLDVASRNDSIGEKTVDSVNELCEKLTKLNVLQDEGMVSAITALKSIMNSTEDSFDVAAQLTSLRGTLEATAEEAKSKAIESLSNLGGGRRLRL